MGNDEKNHDTKHVLYLEQFPQENSDSNSGAEDHFFLNVENFNSFMV